MTTPGYYNTGKRLEEGKRYIFKVIGKVTLQDEQAYYILEDPHKIRHLLPSWLYKYYGIKTGQTITCKVDKINCTGRVYLEPEHPCYKEGQTYDFTVSSINKNTFPDKLSIDIIDIFSNKISVDCPKDLKIDNNENAKISCRIIRIRKGIPKVVLTPDYRTKLNLRYSEVEKSRQTKSNHM